MSDKPESSKAQELKNSKPKEVLLQSGDGEAFLVPLHIAKQSGMIKSVSEINGDFIPLPGVTGPVLAKLIEFWTGKKESRWEEKFFEEMGKDFMFEFLTAANYLDCKEALGSVCQFVADTVQDMSVEDVRGYFEIENDFTPEEEEKVRSETPWAFEDLRS